MLFGSDGPLVPLGIGGQGEIHDGMSIPKRSKAVESFGSFDFCCVERSLERGVCENACIPAHEQLSACMEAEVPTRQAHTQRARPPDPTRTRLEGAAHLHGKCPRVRHTGNV